MRRTRIITRSKVRPPEAVTQPLPRSVPTLTEMNNWATDKNAFYTQIATNQSSGRTQALEPVTTKHGPIKSKSKRKLRESLIAPPLNHDCVTDSTQSGRTLCRKDSRHSEVYPCSSDTSIQLPPNTLDSGTLHAQPISRQFISAPSLENFEEIPANSCLDCRKNRLHKHADNSNLKEPVESRSQKKTNSTRTLESALSYTESSSSNWISQESNFGNLQVETSSGCSSCCLRNTFKNGKNRLNEKKWCSKNQSHQPTTARSFQSNARDRSHILNQWYSPHILGEFDEKNVNNDLNAGDLFKSTLDNKLKACDLAENTSFDCKNNSTCEITRDINQQKRSFSFKFKSQTSRSQTKDVGLGLYFARVLHDTQKSNLASQLDSKELYTSWKSSDSPDCVNPGDTQSSRKGGSFCFVEEESPGNGVLLNDFSDKLHLTKKLCDGMVLDDLDLHELQNSLIVKNETNQDNSVGNINTESISEVCDKVEIVESFIEEKVAFLSDLSESEQLGGISMQCEGTKYNACSNKAFSYKTTILPSAIDAKVTVEEMSGVAPSKARRKKRRRTRRTHIGGEVEEMTDEPTLESGFDTPSSLHCLSCSSSSEISSLCSACREAVSSNNSPISAAVAASLSSPERLRICSSPSFTYDPDIASQIPFYFTEPEQSEEKKDSPIHSSPSLSPVIDSGRIYEHFAVVDRKHSEQCLSADNHRNGAVEDSEDEDSGRSSCNWDEFDDEALVEAVTKTCDAAAVSSSSPLVGGMLCDNQFQIADDVCSIATLSDDVSDTTTHTSGDSSVDDLGMRSNCFVDISGLAYAMHQNTQQDFYQMSH
ncbi:hypothetical protein PoB_006032100 [Plakobranchus ocellatus]|uniref:Uncharacterized protein n=1 Tax=Plakobranchus ocellatus TaxID=259542 RepID=A0AAV4CPN4_9GAST|nr:hypothetical protein PoB_006032100 [Plakobranchus ocellatus]